MHPRLGTAAAIAVTITLALAAPAFAFLMQGVSPSTPGPVMESNANPATNHEDGHPGCKGIGNAFAHVSANHAANGNEGMALESLTRVADMLGCDLALVEPIDDGTTDPETEENGPAHIPDPDKPHGWDTKCDRIAAKLLVAQERPHGKSAEAFARQAERWGCSSH